MGQHWSPPQLWRVATVSSSLGGDAPLAVLPPQPLSALCLGSPSFRRSPRRRPPYTRPSNSPYRAACSPAQPPPCSPTAFQVGCTPATPAEASRVAILDQLPTLLTRPPVQPFALQERQHAPSGRSQAASGVSASCASRQLGQLFQQQRRQASCTAVRGCRRAATAPGETSGAGARPTAPAAATAHRAT